MNTRSKVLLTGIVSAVALSGFLARGVSAQDFSGSNDLISKIARRFNLQESDVKAVFDQHRAEQETQMKNQFSQNLDQAVTNGDLTNAQKDLILNKLEEVRKRKKEIQAIQDQAARREARQQLQTDLKQWADQNGLDRRFLHPFGGPRGHGRGMMEAHMGPGSAI